MSRRFQFSLKSLFLLTLGCGFYFLALSVGPSPLSAVSAPLSAPCITVPLDTDSNLVDMAESDRAKTGRYPPNY